jgi:hypothetical protein
MNARGNSQSRALAIHPPVRTALTPAVGSDFAKVLSKLPPEELERCSELLYNQRARPVQRQQRAAALGSKVTVCTSSPFPPMDRGTIPRGSSPSGFGRASFGVTHPGGVMMLWL